ncbi:sulfite oxidase heme-binding subunit YedZ [Silvimonas amylolytica]|uniref:Protein-methionine-sulfoxide reductase heme-binding subunit MsrQ n=1 Tax=Silvimonas amylolytica TaxID=449663 RepID=A0ABQ2PL29_9NEIS|nr:protein-methionine-sulfoxide reductase heme-binding subunit MsrQ [Silvimonas amylolytica]GGP25679.1 protein-methionine-sulfoxide reductase heme-binding subunit MsrQ [Silvimonas amylolytica]
MSALAIKRLKIVLFLVCLIPLARTAWLALSAVNPIEFITHQTGTWTLIFLLLTLTITPLRQLTGRNELIRFRRMLGLYAFFYVCLHFLTWLVLDHFFDFHAIIKDIIKRPFITVGFLAFVLLIPLAVTSTDKMMRRLKRNWGRLHKLIYVIAPLGVLHYWWLVKRDITQPLIFAVLLGILLAWRVVRRQRAVAAATSGARA